MYYCLLPVDGLTNDVLKLLLDHGSCSGDWARHVTLTLVLIRRKIADALMMPGRRRPHDL